MDGIISVSGGHTNNDKSETVMELDSIELSNRIDEFEDFILDQVEIMELTNENKRIFCDQCLEVFSSEEYMMTHRVHKHPNADLYSNRRQHWKCRHCMFSTQSIEEMKGHIRTIHMIEYEKLEHKSLKRFSCDVCPYSNDIKIHLENHKRTHIGDKKFRCTDCRFNTYHLFSFNQHLSGHCKGAKVFSCKICSYSAHSAWDLKKHNRIHTGQKMYACDICDYRATTKICLTRHTLTHTKERPFKCNICVFSCARSSSLHRHKLIHSGVKQLQCDLCKYKTARLDVLKLHILAHKEGKKVRKCYK